ncbi:MAG: heme A synthase [Synechococcus sp.]
MQNTYVSETEACVSSQVGSVEVNETAVNETLSARFRYCIFVLAGLTFFLMALGSATRVMNAGLSCPDWPLCYGELVPRNQMNLQVFLEWFHRVVATTVGLSAIALVGSSWSLRKSLPLWMPWASLGALGLVIFQGVLGGLTVTELLRFDIVTAHLGTGLLFFSLLLSIAVSLIPISSSVGISPYLPWVGAIATLTIYGQSILGALVASQWALHLCFGESELCGVMNAHLIGILPAATATVAVAIATWRANAKTDWLQRLSFLASLLLIAQLSVGFATYKLHLQVEPLTVTHQAIGAALLGTLLSFTVLSWRQRLHSSTESSEAAASVSA